MRQDAQDRLADGRLAGAGLADDRHGRTAPHAEIEALHRIDMTAGRRKTHRQIADLQQIAHRGGTLTPSAWRLAAVASLNSRPRSAAAIAAWRTSRSKPSSRLSRLRRAPPAPSSSCIQPLLR